MKKNIFIFVGPDRSGKTTIAKELANRIGMQYFKNSLEAVAFQEDGIDFKGLTRYTALYMTQILEQCDFSGGVILDRFVPCEYAYGPIFGREIEEDIIFEADSKLAELGAILVLCYNSDISSENWDDKFVEFNKYSMILNRYFEYVTKTKMRIVVVDTSDQDLDAQINRIFWTLSWKPKS